MPSRDSNTAHTPRTNSLVVRNRAGKRIGHGNAASGHVCAVYPTSVKACVDVALSAQQLSRTALDQSGRKLAAHVGSGSSDRYNGVQRSGLRVERERNMLRSFRDFVLLFPLFYKFSGYSRTNPKISISGSSPLKPRH